MMYDRECLYDVEWQTIRVGMLGTWDTVSSVRANIRTLELYSGVSDDNASHSDNYERFVRCTNYFAAILLGYGSKSQFAVQATLVKAAHTQFTNRKGYYKPKDTIWDWEKAERDLRKASYAFLKDCWNNLQKRVYTSTKRTGGTQHRPELVKFIDLLRAEFTARGVDVSYGKKP